MRPWMLAMGLALLGSLPWPGQAPGIRVALGLLGLGFLAAHRHPVRHWPVVLQALGAGLALLGTAAWSGGSPGVRTLDGLLGLLLVLPTAPILQRAWRLGREAAEAARRPLQEVMSEARTQRGISLLERSREAPLLVVFLRHFGCMFCREALAQLARDRAWIEGAGTRLVLVHMATDPEAEAFFGAYGLADVDRISDPRKWLYFQLGLGRASLWHFLDHRIWWRSFTAAILNRHGVGRLVGDALQMPGAFLVHHGALVSAFVHRTPADRPDYRQLSLCPPPPRA
jgi:hypothetical protein